MLLRPEVQTMAQKELDAVTMRERLPTFEDRPKLPFVDAICKEVKRWKTSVPLGESPPLTRLAYVVRMTAHSCTPRNRKR
jgi:hypothetical protein